MSTQTLALSNPVSIARNFPRWFLGAAYFVFGLNFFLGFLPVPPPPEAAGSFLGALAASGYFFPLLKITEVIAGVALLAGIAAPVALLVLAPITLQILAFHFFLTPGVGNLILPLLLLAAHLAAAAPYWNLYAPLFRKN